TCREQENAHDRGRRRKELSGIADSLLLVGRRNQRHYGDACFEAGEAKRQLRKQDERDSDHYPRTASVVRYQSLPPEMNQVRVADDVPNGNGSNHRVQGQVERDKGSRDPDGFLEALEEDDAQTREKNESYSHLAFQGAGNE